MTRVRTKPMKTVDGGYGWIVVVSAFTVSFLTDGIIYSFGLILVELVDAFKLSRASTALVGSILSSFCHLIGPVAGSILDVYGGRGVVVAGALLSFIGVLASYFVQNIAVLYVTYGVIAGTGMGLQYAPANACVVKHFVKKRTLAQGIAMCGTGFGTFVMNLLVGYLIMQYGWRGAILISSALLLNGVACGLVLLPPSEMGTCSIINEDDRTSAVPLTEYSHSRKKDNTTGKGADDFENEDNHAAEEKNILEEEEGYSEKIDDYTTKEKMFSRSLKANLKAMVDYRALLDYRCFFILASTFISNLAFALPFQLLPDQAVQDGVSAYKAAWLVSSIGFVNTISRIVNGWVGDRPCVNRFVMFESFMFCCGVSLIISPLFRTFETKLIFSCLYGLFIGGYIVLLPVVLADMFGQEVIGKTFGLNRFVIGLSDLIAAPVGGWIFDYTGSYTLTFIIAGVEFIIGGLLILCIYIIGRCRQKQKDQDR